jgi:hypothetical protein
MRTRLSALLTALFLGTVTGCDHEGVVGPEMLDPQLSVQSSGDLEGGTLSFTRTLLFDGSALSINDQGVIAGARAGLPILWRNGVETVIPLGAFTGGKADFVNNRGVAVGTVGTGTHGSNRAFIFGDDGLRVLSADMTHEKIDGTWQLSDQQNQPHGFNDSGAVVGQAWHQEGGTFSYVWNDGEAAFLLGGIPYAINSHGVVVGNLWSPAYQKAPVRWGPENYDAVAVRYTVLIDYFAAAGLREIPLTGVNAAGHVIGYACDGINAWWHWCVQAKRHVGFVHLGDRTVELPALSGDNQASPRAVSDPQNGQLRIVGDSNGRSGSRPVLWTVRLDDLRVTTTGLPTRVQKKTAVGGNAFAINAAGLIVGISEGAVLWTPTQGNEGEDPAPCNPHPRTGVCRG